MIQACQICVKSLVNQTQNNTARTLESLRFDGGNRNDNVTNQWFDWLNEEK